MLTSLSRWTAVLVLIPAPAYAALTFTEVVTTEGSGAGSRTMTSTVLVQVDNGQARLEWKGAPNPMMPAGSYLLAKDGGQNVYLVRPDTKTYARFDIGEIMGPMDDMLGASASALQQVGCKFEVDPPKIEKLLEENGPEISGYPTKHVRFRTISGRRLACTGMMAKSMNSGSKQESIEDIWMTTTVDIGTMARFFGSFGGTPLDENSRKSVDAERAKLTGLPLKRIVVTKSEGTGRMVRGGSTETKVTMEVKDLATGSVDSAVFDIPTGYTETQLMQRGPTMPDIKKIPPR